MEEAYKKEDFTAGGNVKLNVTHKYYYQVQGQMAMLANNNGAILPSGHHRASLLRELDLMQDVLPKLEHFYDVAILLELACPRHPLGQPNGEPVAAISCIFVKSSQRSEYRIHSGYIRFNHAPSFQTSQGGKVLGV